VLTRRGRWIALAAAALWTAIVAGIATSGVRADMLGWDLGVFRDASRLLLHGQPLYDFAGQASAHRSAFGRSFAVYYPYAYPPIFAIETVPLALVSQVTAFVVVTLASALSVAWAARRATGRLEDALWVAASYPAVYGLLAGQLVFVALAVLTASWALLEGDRPVLAGLVASLLAFKPQLLVALPVAFLVMPRARRALLGLAAGVAAQAALALGVAPRATLAFPSAIRRMAAYTSTHFRESLGFTWHAFFVAAMPGHRTAATVLAALAVAACAAVAVVAMVRARADTALTFSIAVLATFACAWHCAPYDWVLLALPAWLLLPRTKPSPIALRVLAMAFIAPWTFVELVDAQQKAWGVALHPAAPALAIFSVWLVRRAQLRARA
jgi:alpha-1,2-mannosyltransferase